MVEKNGHKHNGEDDKRHFKDPNAKAVHNQARMPPEAIRQDLGFNPFDCDTVSDVDASLDLKDSQLDDDSLYQMDKSQHIKPGYGRRRIIDPDNSMNDSKGKIGKTDKNKKFGMDTKKPEEKLGDRMDHLYGPKDSQIKSILSKKVAEKMIKQKIKTEIFKKAQNEKKGKGKFQYGKFEAKKPEFDFIEDY